MDIAINYSLGKHCGTEPQKAIPINLKFNTLRPWQNGRHFADNTFKSIFLNENIRIPIEISLKFVPKVPINNIPALVQIMAWRRPGDKPLSEPMMVRLSTHICISWPQWVKHLDYEAHIKWLAFYRQHSHMHFLSWILTELSLKFDPKCSIGSKSTMIQGMAW